MLPAPHPSRGHRGEGLRRRTGRSVPALVALAVLAGVPGLTGATTASAAPLAATTRTATRAPAPPGVGLSVVAGPTRGGTTLDVTGSGVGAATKVWFGSTVVTRITKVSSTRVRVVTPAHPAGLTNVRVTTPAGTSAVSSRSTFAFDAV